MIRDMWEFIPTWTKIVFVVWLPLAVGGTAYTIYECGFFNSMLLGDKAIIAAMTGMCND